MNKKRIAIFTHFNVCNFGANLQAVSTNNYLRKKGYHPIFINWIGYQEKSFSNVPKEQTHAHSEFIYKVLDITPPLYNEQEIYDYLVENKLYNIILGSDAVFSLHTILDRISINRKGLLIKKIPIDKTYPNPFWLNFLVNDNRFKIAAMSVSSQNCLYHLLSSNIKKNIKRNLRRFNYISVRDKWTQKMIYDIAGIQCPITPDPVWGYNYNLIENSDKKYQKDFNITQPYILLGFQNAFQKGTHKWLSQFINIAHQKGFKCVPLPFAFGYYNNVKYDIEIPFPLSPEEWYFLIKNASGYVGYNMHPIIASMHNNVPCVSVDNYGITFLKYLNIASSSKIYDIMHRLGRKSQRFFIRDFFNSKESSPQSVLNYIENYNFDLGITIREKQYFNYQILMNDILSTLNFE